MEIISYTPGYSKSSVSFMFKRSLSSHGTFFEPYLDQGLSILDCGCGPGAITLSIAKKVFPGNVVGIDMSKSQVELAKANKINTKIENASFITSNCYSLPFEKETFDRVFCHAILEHLSEPLDAMSEMFRVLRPGGYIGVCSPDWGGFIIAPESPNILSAIEAYKALQIKNGGDVFCGRKLGGYLSTAGFSNISMSARYECYSPLNLISEYLSWTLREEGQIIHAEVLSEWSEEAKMFAQTWVSSVGVKNP